MGTTPRTCFYVPYGQHDDQGYIPSLVTENEPGHSPLTGNGAHAQPWHWGRTYEEAEQTCAKMNLERFGLSEKDAAEIVLSSVAARDPDPGDDEVYDHSRAKKDARNAWQHKEGGTDDA